MRRLADLHPGQAKTDHLRPTCHRWRRPCPSAPLRRVDTGDEALAELKVLVSFDDDPAAEVPCVRNRIRGLLTQIHPALERVLGSQGRPSGRAGAAAAVRRTESSASGGPTTTAPPGPQTRPTHGRIAGGRHHGGAGDAQTVTVPSSTAAVLSRLTDSLRTVLGQRKQMATEAERLLNAHPLAQVLTSMPRFGVRTAARVLLEVGDGSSFPPSGHGR
jgi:transposase